MANRRSNSRGLLLLLLTSGFFIMGLLFDYMPMILDNQIKRTVELGTNEEIRAIWSKPPVEFHSYYWLYEALNAEQFASGEKIRIRKTGPYHFTWRPEKRIIELSPNKYRIVYNSTRYMYLNESTSAPLDQPMVLFNAIYGAVVGGAREIMSKVDESTKSMIVSSGNRLMERFNETLFLNLTAREALVGRKVVFVEKLRKMIETFGLSVNVPDMLVDNRFGYVAIMNGTWLGPFEVYTGYQVTMPSLGDIISYQGKRRLTEFKGRCNRLQVSTGELRPMPLNDEQILEMFMPSFCRVVHLRPSGVHKLREGLAIGYSLAREDFSSAKSNPDNQCFCQSGGAEDYCSLEGALELAPCSLNAPLVLTTSSIEPDQRIIGSIQEWESDFLRSDLDQLPMGDNGSQLLILKRFGVPVKIDLTYTLFMKVIRDPHFRHTANVPEVSYIPLVTVREIGSIPPQLGKIIVNLESFLALTQHMKVVMYLSTVLLLCWLTGSYFNRYTRDRVAPSTGSSAALPVGGAGDSMSERVNSADSVRSLPPSRMSRRSTLLDAAAVAEDPAFEASEKERGVAPEGRPKERLSRAFSRQDDELRWAEGLKQPPQLAQRRLRPQAAPAGTSAPEEERPPAANGSGAGAPDGAARMKRRNWFIQGCSNFVRMLIGIRGTLSEAGKLEMETENAFRDKQLELLAGRIENWYSSSTGAGPAEEEEEGPELAEGSRQVEVAPAASSEAEAGDPRELTPAGVQSPLADSDSGGSQVASQQQPEPTADGQPDKAGGGEVRTGNALNSAPAPGQPRKDSVQSNQTVINNNNNNTNSKSDTSGDESSAPGALQAASRDKEAALEQMELAMAS